MDAGLGASSDEAPGSWSPAVDLLETSDGFLLRAELPGVLRQDLTLQIRDRRLELSGERKHPQSVRSFHQLECHYGPFRRSFELSDDIDADTIEARLEAGVLEVRLGKNAEASGPRTVAISLEATDG